MSPGNLGVFVCARQAAVAVVSGGSSSQGNLYSKHSWFQHECVPHFLHLLDHTVRQLVTDNSDSALQVIEDEQVEGAFVCCAHVCVPCAHVCCGVRSVRSLRLFHRVAQSGKQQRGWCRVEVWLTNGFVASTWVSAGQVHSSLISAHCLCCHCPWHVSISDDEMGLSALLHCHGTVPAFMRPCAVTDTCCSEVFLELNRVYRI